MGLEGLEEDTHTLTPTPGSPRGDEVTTPTDVPERPRRLRGGRVN